MTIEVKPRIGELYEQMRGGALYRAAAEKGLTLSAFLEQEDPVDRYGPTDEMRRIDAFQRMVAVAGLKVVSDPFRGFYADEFSQFDRNEQTRALMPEWAFRQWRRVTLGFGQNGYAQRAAMTSDAEVLGGVMRPYVDAAQARMQQLAPAVPLSEIVAITTPINGNAYRAFYLTEPAASEKRMVRVGEAAEIPKVTLAGGDNTINLYKYGRVLEVSYETLRRQRIDKVALWIARMAIQAETDKVAYALDVLVNGDGNTGSAATNYNLTTLDAAAVAGTLTLKGWLNYKLQFANPYQLTHMLVQSAVALQVMLLNLGSANVPLVTVQGLLGAGSIEPINPETSDRVRYGITSDAPTLKVVGFDRRFALERVTEVGADISETERFITRQTQALAMSEVEGFAIFDANATRTLDINA